MKPTQKKGLPRELFAASITPSSVDAENRDVDVVFYTGAQVQRGGFFSDPYFLTLSLDPGHVRLGRLNNGAPVLDSHWDRSLKDVIGVVEKGWLENGQAVAKLRFSDRAEVEPVWNDIKTGIIRNISVGAVIHQMKEITAEGEAVKSYLAVDWEPMEISVVPIPADPGAGFLGYEDQAPEIPRASALEKTENTTMEEQATIMGETKQDARAQIDLEAEKEKARLTERNPVTGICRAVKATAKELINGVASLVSAGYLQDHCGLRYPPLM
jgi:hypothetical protein